MSEVTPTFTGEIQMRRWSDSSTQGVQVTFALPDSADLEPLKAKAGRRFMAVLVELGDDEQPAPPAPRKDTRGPLCREACDLCAMPEFQAWIHERFDFAGPPSEAAAKEAILSLCAVDSRKDLDTYKASGEAFVGHIRIPFMRYMASRKKAA